jgi:hypothetical protein
MKQFLDRNLTRSDHLGDKGLRRDDNITKLIFGEDVNWIESAQDTDYRTLV